MMCQIHRAGIRHHGFAKYNVLDNSRVPIVIGFEDATEEVCQYKMEIIVDAFTPHPPDFNCKELFDVCQELEIWKPSLVLYGHQYVDVYLLEDVDELVKMAPPYWSRQRAYSTASRTIEEHAKG
ncbi:hypothetical protein HETIRDRAFT_331650 [Heterobasidion irregulare TC 32-1]|uniref:Uncharacterized protein n=1 Tax=Heterobasidion irregulare (strain TC 32-1) TaxID=747525 RepID=W4JQR5_HETIT|nr:uncharacterized protein HETIRDRAFT_331650 [Heterobasidion irregulare TC 32-1]ETW75425.1 hypothetical protein HETIRDRAFT_331650 [Heterobasidion irregulare TC 32-1]